jgi:hypothetical protein
MSQQADFAILVYGNTSYLDVVKQKLRSLANLSVIHVDTGIPQAIKGLFKLKAQLMIYDQETVSVDVVTAYLFKNPSVPVVGFGMAEDRKVVVTYREFTRLEASGLPQVLRALGDGDSLA